MNALTHAPVPVFPNFDIPFVIFTDASGVGIGAVLMQTDSAGKQHVIAFPSPGLAPVEKNYSVTHLEILAVVWALQHFRDIVFSYPIIIYTDHSPITAIFKHRNLNGRLARWYLTIQACSPEMKYTKGRQNVVTDTLSRNVRVGAAAEASPIPNFSMKDLCSAQREHPLWKKAIYALESGDETQLPELLIPFLHFFLIPRRDIMQVLGTETSLL